MAEVFSDEWMQKYKSLWNGDKEHITHLANSEFSASVGFGLVNEDQPRIVFEIQNGLITGIGSYDRDMLDWDIRGMNEFWVDVSKKAPSIMKLGLAYTSRDLRFYKGDYSSMIKDPRLSTAFIKCFKFMSSVYQ